MRAKCQEHVQANAGILHCGSRTSKKLWSSLQKAQKALGMNATPEAIAAHLKLDPADVQRCLASMSSRGVSMDKPLGEGGATIATVTPDRGLRQDVRMERTQNSEDIANSLKAFASSLNDRQRAILAGRIMHDLLGREQRCAKTFGVSKQRVGQIEKQLRTKLVTHFTRAFGEDGVDAMLRSSF
jgi:DNA-directed RNA polymerase sigma subunit (sigma70/sigma32)